MNQFYKDNIESEEFLEEVFRVFNRRKSSILPHMGHHTLVMGHFFLVDSIGHMMPGRLEEGYTAFEDLVEDTASRIDKDTWLICVSDHGLKDGYHSPNAFWSSNLFDLGTPSLIDYYDLIYTYLGGADPEPIYHEEETGPVFYEGERKTVEEHLKRLGYFD